MNEFFQKLFSKLPHPTENHHQPNPVTAQDHSAHATRFQLVQMVLRSIMRKYGIAPDWIELKELVVPGRTQGLGMHIRLVLKHWDPNLMNHAQALQNQILSDIKRYEPNWKEWLYGITWQLEMNASCPYVALPDKPFWVAPEPPDGAAPATAAPAAPAHGPIAPPGARPASASPAAALPASAPPAAPMAPAMPATHAGAIAAASVATAAAALAAQTPEAAPTAPAPAKPGSGEHHTTLERLFALRDHELGEKITRHRQPGQTDFEDTQPLDEDEADAQGGAPSGLARLDPLASRPPL